MFKTSPGSKGKSIVNKTHFPCVHFDSHCTPIYGVSSRTLCSGGIVNSVREWAGKESRHPSQCLSSLLTCMPQCLVRLHLTKRKFKDKTIKNFKMVTEEHYTKCEAFCTWGLQDCKVTHPPSGPWDDGHTQNSSHLNPECMLLSAMVYCLRLCPDAPSKGSI